MAGRAEARKIVEEMGKKNGYIPADLRATMQSALPKEAFDDILELMANLKQQAATSVKTLAQNLYSSSAKFVFELLQNYDDNHYDSTRGPPSVAFHIYEDRIVATCNENGFTAENVQAICSVGQSSKKQTQSQLAGDAGYTGEKGIGFKSVFMAAEDVHIQSGDYSFRFKYAKGDSGLGMTTPIWADHDEALDAQLSHITLTLRSDGLPGDAARRQEIIHEQFHNIHDSILLFMKKLQEIKVYFYDADENLESVTTFSIDRLPHKTTVKKSRTTFEDPNREKVTKVAKSYIMVKHIVTNLAPSENRRELDGESQNTTNGVVVLGFPVDAKSEPVLQNEYLFAFLPVKKMGFKFLIHADFVTQANREDIVVTSDRNRGLSHGIAEAFVKAVCQFLSHDTLRFQWMRYLPHASDYPWDGFWKGVIEDIRSCLALTPVLRSQHALPGFRLISDSRRLLPSMLDRNGKALVPDIAPNRYLSQQYQDKDLLLLEDYGLEPLSSQEWVERVSRDLASPFSVMRASNDEDWHTRVADLLRSSLKSPSATVRQAVQQLQLCPLRGGNWVRVSAAVYYPQPEGTDLVIPPNVNLAVVDAAAIANPARKRLFDGLGARSASVHAVREAIFEAYEGSISFTARQLIDHTHFLYRTHHLARPPHGYNRLYIASQTLSVRKSCNTDVDMYIADGTPYGVEMLLATDNGAPGFKPIFIVNDTYFTDAPSPPTSQSLAWKEWLHRFHGVRQTLRLVDVDDDGDRRRTSLSAVGKYVAEHRPEKFLGFLQATWASSVRDHGFPFLEQLADIEVLCEGGRKARLDTTFFPFKRLKKLSDRFLDGEFFPWLQLETEIVDDEAFLSSWASLDNQFDLGYRCPPWRFLLDVLKYIKQGQPDLSVTVDRKRMYELYVRLQAEARASSPDDRLAEMIRLDVCVWEAPVDMYNVIPIAKYCQREFPDLYRHEYSSLENFFSMTLQIRDAEWRDLVSELDYMYDEDMFDFDKANELYGSLSAWLDDLSEDDKSELRDAFRTRRLIYEASADDANRTDWHRSTECLWTSATQIRGMITLNDIYPDQKRFFVDGLGVKTMTAKMVYDKLMGPPLSVDETKQTIHTFNSLLVHDTDARKLDGAGVFGKQVFPVRLPGGDVQLCFGKESFVLVDRESLADKFAGQAKFFDFDMDDVRFLQPFIAWAGLGHKYVSKMVREISCVAGDDKRPISSRDRDIRRKARALFSLALAYRSPRVVGRREKPFYALLRHAETIETDNITSELHLDQDGKVLTVTQDTATFHLREDDTSLKFYVPKDKARQELCFNATLPENICLWLMTEATTMGRDQVMPEMVHIAQRILSAKAFAMHGILDYCCVKLAAVPDGEDDEEEEDPVADGEDDDEEEVIEPSRPSVQEPESPQSSDEVAVTTQPLASVPRQRVAWTDSDDEETTTATTVTDDEELYLSALLARTRLSTSAASPLPQVSPPSPHDNSYAVLLERLVDAATQASIPSRGNVFVSTMPNTGAQRDNRWFRDASPDEKYKQIGAAGEFFVYTLLSHLEGVLPGFSLHNWPSTIRGYARSHPLHADIQNWVGQETADITYEDTDGTLTAMLIEKGYLAADVWAAARPRYFIEVKTTVNAAIGTPFYMSNHQYTRMQNCSADGPGDRGDGHDPLQDVYMIMRVFGLGAGFVGFRLLVDPERMRRRGELVFTAPESWSVAVL